MEKKSAAKVVMLKLTIHGCNAYSNESQTHIT